MADLSLKQIIDKLNQEFTGEERRLVFWYDENGDFAEDIDRLRLANAKVWKLTGKNQFRTKILLEQEDKDSNYLIYAPFHKPPVQENHLEDMMLYSGRFSADRASLLLIDLNLDDGFKPLIEKHIRFFASKDRLQRFLALDMDTPNENAILTAMMCVICRVKVIDFDNVLQTIFSADSLQENLYLRKFAKYHLSEDFWRFCQKQFGYTDRQPNLTKLAATLFVTAASRAIHATLPTEWQIFVTEKSGNCIAFLDSMRNNICYQDSYRRLADAVAESLQAESNLRGLPIEAVCHADTFRCLDEQIIRWATERLQTEDTAAVVDGMSLGELFAERQRLHYGEEFHAAYAMLTSAWKIISHSHYYAPKEFKVILQQYVEQDYAMDADYRHFYESYDELDNQEPFCALRELVENIYTNEYLGHQLPAWNEALVERGDFDDLPRQLDFYRQHVKLKREKTVVIISDALRYEVGQELFHTLNDGARYQAKLGYMLATLPSYTRLGMSALLPHKKIELKNGKEFIDGIYAPDFTTREKVVQDEEPKSACVKFDDIKNMKKLSLRKIFTDKKVVYVFHDQIDNAGEHSTDDVFTACEIAVQEIANLIHKLTIDANTQNFFVTADHGFIYKRDSVEENGKINGVSDKYDMVGRRYIIADVPVEDKGICHLPLAKTLDNDSKDIVSFPLSYNVFKRPGSGGLNYVHGGSSPQELIVPLIEVHSEKKHTETHPVEISVVTMLRKVTNILTAVEFVQSEPVGDTVLPAAYDIYFVDAAGTLVSNIQNYVADNPAESTADRIFRLDFQFKDQAYDHSADYFLIIKNQETGAEITRHRITIDLAFASNLSF